MYEIHDLSTDAMSAELAYRHSQMTGHRAAARVPRARWWRRRPQPTAR